MALLLRADASPEIGTGHVMRCLALAQAWLNKIGRATLVTSIPSPALEERLQLEGITVIQISAISGSQADADLTVAQARSQGANWIVVDGYQFNSEYQRTIKAAGLKLVAIDDYGHADYYWANLVLNQNIYAHDGLYCNREPGTQLLLGTEYVLLRKEFWPWKSWQRKISSMARKILITLGGADVENVTFKVIQALQAVDDISGLEAVVVVGGSNPHYKELQGAIQDSEVAITLRRNVTNMPELMAWADIAVAAGGSTCWEMAFMGLPSILIVIADNQRAIAKELALADIAVNLGWHAEVSIQTLESSLRQLLSSQKKRASMAQCSQNLVDGQGCFLVMERMTKMTRL